MRWTGPLDDDLEADGVTLKRVVPPERWPWGPPVDHEKACMLFQDGLYCDCSCSSNEETNV